MSRSPIYADFSEILGGLSSIRAYNQMSRFVRRLEERVNHNSIAAVTQQLAGQWLAIRLDILGAFISFFIVLIAVATSKYDFIPPGYLALGLSYSFTITNFLKFGVRIMATTEAHMNSVERIMFYCEVSNSSPRHHSMTRMVMMMMMMMMMVVVVVVAVAAIIMSVLTSTLCVALFLFICSSPSISFSFSHYTLIRISHYTLAVCAIGGILRIRRRRQSGVPQWQQSDVYQR
jgi:hypothetical protein